MGARNGAFSTGGLIIPGSSLHGGSLYRGLRYIVARNRVFVKWGLVIPGSSLHRDSLYGVFVT